MRALTEILIHCSATKEGEHFDSSHIRKWHLDFGFYDIGYHFIVLLDGTIEVGRPIHKMGAHCKGRNRNTIGICYIGGLNKDDGSPKDTRTPEQIRSLETLVTSLKTVFNTIDVISPHYKYSNKSCPCFDVDNWVKENAL